MAIPVPTNAVLTAPSWLWGGNPAGFFAAANLGATAEGDVWRVTTAEHVQRAKPNLVRALELAGPAVGQDQFAALRVLESESMEIEHQAGAEDVEAQRARLIALAEHGSRVGDPTAAFALFQLEVLTASRTEAPARVKWVYESVRQITALEHPGKVTFPNAGVEVIIQNPALFHRVKIPTLLLRLTQDAQLRDGDRRQLQQATARGEEVFASSSSLHDGIRLFDAYLGPLLGALAPWVWAFSAFRMSGVYVFTLGQTLAGTTGYASELLQLLPNQGPLRSEPPPILSPRASSRAVQWWSRRLNTLFGVLTDPAVFVDQAGDYQPVKHLQAMLTVEQLFRRVAAIQTTYRDNNVRRVLLFTVLDTIADGITTSRTIDQLCSLPFATKTLARLRSEMSPEVAQVLLPAAERAVSALAEVEEGFFLRRQMATQDVELIYSDGRTVHMAPAEAATAYIKVLRNATHGHGSNQPAQKELTNALLAHHSGNLPPDLAQLGYLYLLDLLSNPEQMRRNLYNGGKD